ncbi:probable kinetochore protein Spc24p [[Candida] jaroonii]|uniref:Probable kinetochore protein Spc24p n=1 Tax=[Candida] jaroonii TaxID=467808 RepID=A0ACA9Y556_9ASCO|nr:probable kinetochore protein Spc24p [[Candida] jaroonii]
MSLSQLEKLDLIPTSIETQQPLKLIDNVTDLATKYETIRNANLEKQYERNNLLKNEINTLTENLKSILKDITGTEDINIDLKDYIKKKSFELDSLKLKIGSDITLIESEIAQLKSHKSEKEKLLDSLDKQLKSIADENILDSGVFFIKLVNDLNVALGKDKEGNEQILLNGLKFLPLSGYNDYFITNYIWDNM